MQTQNQHAFLHIINQSYMDDVSEALERTIADCNYEIARQRALANPQSTLCQQELIAAERATRFSAAYREGDWWKPTMIMTRSDYLLLSIIAALSTSYQSDEAGVIHTDNELDRV